MLALIGQISVGWITFIVTSSNCAILIMFKILQVFVFLAAEYETPKNALNQVYLLLVENCI